MMFSALEILGFTFSSSVFLSLARILGWGQGGGKCLILPGGCTLRQLSFLSYVNSLHPFQEKKKNP